MVYYIVFITVMIIILMSSIYMFLRNNAVYKYRIGLLDRISKAAEEDINMGRDWRWRYDILHKVTYQEMVWKFWKPISSFYNHYSLVNFLGDDVLKGEEVIKNGHYNKGSPCHEA